MLFFISFILCKQLSKSLQNGVATISFDEGPTKYTEQVLKILRTHNVKAIFHLNINKINEQLIIEKIVKQGHTIGLAIVADVNEIDNFDQYFKEQKQDFIKKTGYIPLFVRLPRFYYEKMHVKIAEKNNMIVTKPNLDSEDTDRIDFLKELKKLVRSTNLTSISLLLHDKMHITVEALPVIFNILRKKYEIVSFNKFYNIKTPLMKAKIEYEDEKEDMDEDEDENEETMEQDTTTIKNTSNSLYEKKTNKRKDEKNKNILNEKLNRNNKENIASKTDESSSVTEDTSNKKMIMPYFKSGQPKTGFGEGLETDTDQIMDFEKLLNDETVKKSDIKEKKEKNLSNTTKNKTKLNDETEEKSDDDNDKDEKNRDKKDKTDKDNRTDKMKGKKESSAYSICFYYGMPLIAFLILS